MELSVYNIKGEDTGKKVTLNDAVFGIEPNEHAIYDGQKETKKFPLAGFCEKYLGLLVAR